jgi:Sld7 C-terminal domain
MILLLFKVYPASTRWQLSLTEDVEGITLTTSSNFKSGNKALISQNAELSFLSFVVPSRIPLYLVAGRGLDVWTDNEATESWFRNVFLNSPGQFANEGGESTAWWNTHRFQSDIGILLHVKGHFDSVNLNSEADAGPKITEVLLYGAISETSKAERLPTPLSLSSPTLPVAVSGSATTTAVVKQLRVHALLLSSEMVYSEAQADTSRMNAGDLTTPKAPFRESGLIDAQFLPPILRGKNHETQPLLKRRRDETLFEDAPEKSRKTSKSDNKTTSQAIAGSGPFLNAESESLVNTGENPVNFSRSSREGSISTKPQNSDNRHNWLSRSGSPHLPDIAVSKGGKSAGQTQITRRRNTLNDTRRSLLSTLTDTPKGDGEHRVSQTGILESLDLPETQKTIEIRNKEMLSRIVMAGMRIYGLQQQKKPNKLRGVSEGSIATDSQAFLEIDEYKLVYHQTFKGACFAFVSSWIFLP